MSEELVPIEVPEATYRKVERLAKQAGKTVDTLLSEILSSQLERYEAKKKCQL